MLMRTAVCLALVAAVAVAASNEPADSQSKIKQLREERIAVLSQLRDAVMALHDVGAPGATFEQVYRAERLLIRARLELATTRQERIQLHEQLVVQADKWLSHVTALGDVAALGGSAVDVLKAKAHSLEARIALEQAKAPD